MAETKQPKDGASPWQSAGDYVAGWFDTHGADASADNLVAGRDAQYVAWLDRHITAAKNEITAHESMQRGLDPNGAACRSYQDRILTCEGQVTAWQGLKDVVETAQKGGA